MKAVLLFLAMALALAACSRGEAPEAEAEVTSPDITIAPDDFAVRRCAGPVEGAPCLIVQAGGKALLFSAPEGAMSALDEAGIALPDAVFLPSLDPVGLEGLARVRNETWKRGRTMPLALSGPEGAVPLATGLDAAFAKSDAVVYLRERPRGTFDTALIDAREIAPGTVMSVFDTGDLRVDGLAAPSSELTYLVRYAGAALQISPCEGDVRRLPGLVVTLELSCEAQSETTAWPATQPVILIGD